MSERIDARFTVPAGNARVVGDAVAFGDLMRRIRDELNSRPRVKESQMKNLTTIDCTARTFEIKWTSDALRSVLGYGPETSLAGKEWSVTMQPDAPHAMRISVCDTFTPEQALKLADEIRDAARDLQAKEPK